MAGVTGIQVDNVTKRIGDVTIVSGITFDVRPGEVFGLLGVNGAGKTTVLRMICGLVRPSDGDIFVDGYSILRDRVAGLRRMGALIEYPVFPDYLTGHQVLRYLSGMGAQAYRASRVKEILHLTSLESARNQRVATYSLGMKQRLGLAQALLGNPSVVVLDEPTNGLDPEGIIGLRKLIRQLADNHGVAVLVSSHLLHEASHICDRFGVVHAGKLVACGSLNEVLEQGDQRHATLEEAFQAFTAGRALV